MADEARPLLPSHAPVTTDDDDGNKRFDFARTVQLIVPTGIGIFLYAFDSTLIPASYAVIGSEFNQLQHTGWIATAYMLMLASIQPLYGKLSDVFGRKACILFAYTVYGLGCLCCGLSRNMPQLIAARALAGVGGAGLITLVSILVADLVPLRTLGTWNGILNIIFVLGQSAGSPVGGALADGPGWRWAFLLQLPLLMLGVLSVLTILQAPQSLSESMRDKFKRVDFPGALCLVVAISALLVGLDRGGNTAWLDTVTLGALIVSAIAFIAFWTVETRFAKEPFAPRHILLHRDLLSPYLCDFFSIGSDSCVIFFLPLYFQAVERKTAIHAGAVLVPAAIAATIGTLVGGWSVQKTGKYWKPIFFAYSVQALGTLLVSLMVYSGSSLQVVVAAYILSSFGCGFGITATVVAIVANAGKKAQAIATAIAFLFRSLGAVVGILLGGTIMQNALRSLLRSKLQEQDLDVDKIVEGVRASLTYLDTLPSSVQLLVRSTYREATFFAFIFATVLAVAAVLNAYRITEKSITTDSTEQQDGLGH